MVKNLPAMQETQLRSLGQEDFLEKKMATQSSILAWRIPWTVEPGGLQSTGSQTVRHDWATNTSLQEESNLPGGTPFMTPPFLEYFLVTIRSDEFEQWAELFYPCADLPSGTREPWPWHLRICWSQLQAKLRRSLVSKKQPSPLKACLSNQQCSSFLRLSSLKYVQKFYTVFIFKHALSCETPMKPRWKMLCKWDRSTMTDLPNQEAHFL